MKEEGDGDDYEVGFGRPPKKFQFKKGESGNEAGRPRKQPSAVDLPSHQLVLEEAYRLMKLKEGDEIIELPAIQVQYRAIIRGGINGNTQAQKLSTELVARAEAVIHKNRNIEAGILRDLRDAYQRQLLKHREEWKQSGNFAWALIIRQDQQAWDSINDRMSPDQQGELVGRLTEEELKPSPSCSD